MTTTTGHLERLVPRPHFAERHERIVACPPEQCWQALHGLRADDLTISMALLRVRQGRNPLRPGPADAAVADLPAMQAFAPRIALLDPPREVVLTDIARYGVRGTTRSAVDATDLQAFAGFDEPGWCRVAMNFRLEPIPSGARVVTQTRVTATDPLTRLTFAGYWAAIRLGSGLIRQDILRALAHAAQRGPSPGGCP